MLELEADLVRNEKSLDDLTSMRYTVRRAPKQRWMVWDTESRTVAVVDDMPAIGISAETAKLFADMLNSQDAVVDKGSPNPVKC
jgi:hypothetical protein